MLLGLTLPADALVPRIRSAVVPVEAAVVLFCQTDTAMAHANEVGAATLLSVGGAGVYSSPERAYGCRASRSI